MKTRRGQGPLVFPGGSGAKVNLARGQGWVVTAGPGGHPGGVRAVPGAGLSGGWGEPALLPADRLQMLWLRRLWRGR